MKYISEIKFHLNQGWGDYQNLWLIKIEGLKSYNGYIKDGNIVWEEVEEGSPYADITPFLRVGRFFPIQELINALTNEKKATAQIETLSELKATKYHLEDMRSLVFKNKHENK